MLPVKRTGLLLMLCFIAVVARAQQNEGTTPAFSQFSTRIDINEATLAGTLTLARGQQTILQLAPGFNFPGQVISNTQVYDNLQTIIIKSPEFRNALLQVSKQTLADNTVNYVGRIICAQSSDGFEIKKDAAGNYLLQKFETSRLLQDCNMQ